jgi:protocatechuate 3,4-dioxygenase beta subunit
MKPQRQEERGLAIMVNEKQHEQHDVDIYDLGLQADLAMWTRKPVERRRILKMGMLGIGVLLAGCGANAATPTATNTAATTSTAASTTASTAVGTATSTATATKAAAASTAASASASAAASSSTVASAPASSAASTVASTTTANVAEIPQETAGPYPADGSQASSQMLNALTLSGIVRQDIRTSLTTMKVAQGIPTTIELTLVNSQASGAPLAGFALYLWHCDREGRYSLYSNGVTSEDYLRGVQVTDSNGKLSFTTIFPACYAGRWPHAHFEIYPSLEQATSSKNAIHTSQLALPEDVCKVVYATNGYAQSVKNLSQVSLAKDNVFSDGYDLQVATVTGDSTNGYVVRLTVGVDV